MIQDVRVIEKKIVLPFYKDVAVQKDHPPRTIIYRPFSNLKTILKQKERLRAKRSV